MDKFYYQGKKSFPEDAGELTYTPVTFISKEQKIVILTTSSTTPTPENIEEYIIEGFDNGWLFAEQLKGNMNPVRLLELSPLNTADNSYTLTDEKILSKVRRFSKNAEESIYMKKLTKRTVY